MTPPPPGYPSAASGPPNHEPPSTPPTGTSTDNNGNDKGAPWALPLPPPPGRSRLQGKKGLLTVATGILLFVFAMTAATAIGTSNRMDNQACKRSVEQSAMECRRKKCDEEALAQEWKDCGTVPVSYFGGWRKAPSKRRHKREYVRRDPEYEPGYESGSGYEPGRRTPPEPETEWEYDPGAAVLVHFWMFALSDFPSALVAIFVLANIAIFRRALFYFIALSILAICFLVYLVAPIVITATTLSAISPKSNMLDGRLGKDVAPTVKEALAYDCPGDNGFCDRVKTYQSWEITAIVLMWLFWLISALLRAGYLFMLFQAWKKQKSNDGDSIR